MSLSFSGPGLWYATRATGLVTLMLLTAAVVLGILTAGRFAGTTWPRFLTIGLHRNISLLAVAFLGLHVGTTVVDAAGIGTDRTRSWVFFLTIACVAAVAGAFAARVMSYWPERRLLRAAVVMAAAACLVSAWTLAARHGL
jgi:hypothetical protein